MDKSRIPARRAGALSSRHPDRRTLSWRFFAPLLIAGLYYLLSH
jgi:hypothetical protein